MTETHFEFMRTYALGMTKEELNKTLEIVRRMLDPIRAYLAYLEGRKV